MREKIKVPFFDWRPNLVPFFFYTITRNMHITSHTIYESILRPTQKGRDQRWMPYQNPDGSKTWLAVKWNTERSRFQLVAAIGIQLRQTCWGEVFWVDEMRQWPKEIILRFSGTSCDRTKVAYHPSKNPNPCLHAQIKWLE